MKLLSDHEVVPLEGEELRTQARDWKGYQGGLVRLSPGRWLFPTNYARYANGIYNFKFRASDVVIVTWPKCGTNWTQEIIWTMRNNPNFDHPMANVDICIRSPFIDFDMLLPVQRSGMPHQYPNLMEAFQKLCPGRNPEHGVNLQLGESIQDPRTIKCHLPFSLMPPTTLESCKVVYVARNPKDVVVSYHHHSKIISAHGYVGNFDDFVQYFVDDDLVYGPYWLHLKEAWEKRDHPNLHFMFYEDMKANPLEELKRLNVFLDTNLTEAQLERIVKYTSFDEMKARWEKNEREEEEKKKKMEKSQTNQEEEEEEEEGADDGEESFFRKGVVGDWKNKLTPVLEAKVDQWIDRNLKDFGVNFKYGN